jgi:hypothetical protein
VYYSISFVKLGSSNKYIEADIMIDFAKLLDVPNKCLIREGQLKPKD